ncbi:MAG: HEPN domain-containing protein [Cyanobacteria bacterium P01_C01_bin.120]
MSNGSEDLVHYRLRRAQETLVDAQILAQAGRWDACMNRLYYSCFYAVSALLARDGLVASKHSGVRGLFNREYVKPGLISKDLARLYNDLFERRQEADYLDFLTFDQAQVEPLLPTVETFINHIAELLSDRHAP